MPPRSQSCDPKAMGAATETGENEAERVLIERAQAGDEDAFRQLVEIHLPQVWKVVWRILRHDQDTEDVVQEVFLAAHHALGEFRREARLSTWLHRIAINKALSLRDRAADRLRRASHSIDDPVSEDGAGLVLPDHSPAASPLRHLEAQELRRRLAHCLGLLPAAWRALLVLRETEGRAYEDLAGLFGLELGTVRSRLARARQALKRCVEGGADEPR